MSADQLPSQNTFSVRLSHTALARMDNHPTGRSSALRAAVEAVVAGKIPAGPGPRSLTQVSAKVSAELVDQARAAAAAHVPPLKLPEAIEAVLLAEK